MQMQRSDQNLKAIAAALAPLVVAEIGSILAKINARADQLLDENDAARLVGLSPATLKSHRKRRTGPPYMHVGGGKRPAVRYARVDLLRWAAERRVSPSQQGAGR
jgi:hypothetical protein